MKTGLVIIDDSLENEPRIMPIVATYINKSTHVPAYAFRAIIINEYGGEFDNYLARSLDQNPEYSYD